MNSPATKPIPKRRPPERILVMAFRVSISAPAEMDNTDLAKMTAHANALKEGLGLTAAAIIPGSYCSAIEVEEVI